MVFKQRGHSLDVWGRVVSHSLTPLERQEEHVSSTSSAEGKINSQFRITSVDSTSTETTHLDSLVTAEIGAHGKGSVTYEAHKCCGSGK